MIDDTVYVRRIREYRRTDRGLNLWVVAAVCAQIVDFAASMRGSLGRKPEISYIAIPSDGFAQRQPSLCFNNVFYGLVPSGVS